MIGKIMAELRRKVTNLEEKMRTSTPTEVLEIRRGTDTQVVKRIEEAEEACAKVLD